MSRDYCAELDTLKGQLTGLEQLVRQMRGDISAPALREQKAVRGVLRGGSESSGDRVCIDLFFVAFTVAAWISRQE